MSVCLDGRCCRSSFHDDGCVYAYGQLPTMREAPTDASIGRTVSCQRLQADNAANNDVCRFWKRRTRYGRMSEVTLRSKTSG